MPRPPCQNCDSTGWVCEAHPDRPWGDVSTRADACYCGGAGQPCAICNPSDARNPPDTSGLGVEWDDDDGEPGAR